MFHRKRKTAIHRKRRTVIHCTRKSVYVRQYTRYRFGKFESVCQHWRSHPGQLSLF